MRTAILLIIFIAVTGFICSEPPTGPNPPDDNKPDESRTLLSLGDSYTIGQSVSEAERWPTQLVDSLRKNGLDVQSPKIIARTGWTTTDLISAIERENPQGPFDLVTLLIGVNNQYRGSSEQQYRTEFTRLLDTSVRLAGNDSTKVVVLSIPDWGVTPFAQFRDTERVAQEIDRFNTINKSESNKAGVNYINITDISRRVPDQPNLIAADDLHPSGIMYKEWVKRVFPIAKKILK